MKNGIDDWNQRAKTDQQPIVGDNCLITNRRVTNHVIHTEGSCMKKFKPCIYMILTI